MKNLLIVGAASVALLIFGAVRANAQASNGETSLPVSVAKLSNSDILDMVKVGLPEEIIVAKLQGQVVLPYFDLARHGWESAVHEIR